MKAREESKNPKQGLKIFSAWIHGPTVCCFITTNSPDLMFMSNRISHAQLTQRPRRLYNYSHRQDDVRLVQKIIHNISGSQA